MLREGLEGAVDVLLLACLGGVVTVRKGVHPMLDGDSFTCTHMILVAFCHTTFAFYDSTINRAVSPTPRAANLILGLVTVTCDGMLLSGMGK